MQNRFLLAYQAAGVRNRMLKADAQLIGFRGSVWVCPNLLRVP